jgi:hypothetical protein
VPRPVVQDIPSTPHFPFLAGAFRLSRWGIPYFASTVGVNEAANYLLLTNEIPGSEEINWQLEELYQRDVDWPRVERSIVPYLRNQEAPQFFNSITIALVPFSPSQRRIEPDFGSSDVWSPPGVSQPDRFERTLDIGPLSFGFWNDWQSPEDAGFQSGELRWNTTEVMGVAIDGQHRLAALKSLSAGSPPTLADTRVPVLFLVFDPQLGYVAPEAQSIVELLRVLFIDLNKHAQTVSRARQILLDDRDPHAVCLRSVVGTELTEDLNELSLPEPRLPLSLVDWHREQAKFDDGPYLATVLGIDWIVSEVLGGRPISDYTDYNAVKKQLQRLRNQLGIDLSQEWSRVQELEDVRLSPFGYRSDELEAISDAFSYVWARPISELLTRFAPYSEYLAVRINDGSLSLDFQHWYRLYERQAGDVYAGRANDEYRQFLSRLSSREQPISEEFFKRRLREHEENKKGNLAFNVVFQRALVAGYLEYSKIDHAAILELEEYGYEDDSLPDFDIDIPDDADSQVDEEFEDLSEVDYEAPLSPSAALRERALRRAEEYVASLNRLVEAWPDLLSVNASFPHGESGELGYFWAGTLRKAEGGIDFTQGASSRAKELLFMVAAMRLYDNTFGPDERSDFEEFWSWSFEEGGPSVINRFARSVKRFSNSEGSAAGRILRARDAEYEYERAVEEAFWRLKHVWEVMEL